MNGIAYPTVNVNNKISYKGSRQKPVQMMTVKAHNSIDEYYEKELKMIQKQKQDKSIIEKLNPQLIMEKIKNKILILTENHQ